MDVFALVSLALVAGAVSFSSPCVLPLRPGHASYASGLCGTSSGGGARASRLGLAQQERVRLGAGLIVAGFATVFAVLGAAASVLGLIDFARGIGLASVGC